MKRRIQQVLEWSYGCYAWIIFSLILLPAGGIIVLLRRPSYTRPVARSAARAIFRLVGVQLSAHGLDRLPDKPHILLVNHTSFLDPLVLAALLPAQPGYAFTTRQQFPSQRLLCPLVRALGTVVLRPADERHKSPNIGLLRTVLRRGNNLIVFPEGRFAPEEGLGHFHSGAFVVAAKENVPLVIAGLRGARAALRLGTWRPHRTAIHLDIGPVLMPEGKDNQSLAKLIEAAHDAMLPLTGEEDLDAQS